MAKVKALVNGVWHPEIAETPTLKALFERDAWRFRHWVTADGSSGFPAAPGRYHLYVSYACPWAQRTILYRRLKGLEGVIGMSVLHPRWAGPDGWTFGDTAMSTVDHAGGRRALHEVYAGAAPDYSGKVSVPLLWDAHRGTIVSTESADIIRMLNSAFDGVGGDPAVDFYPERLRGHIESMNAVILPRVCAGVYRVGFARSQAAYQGALKCNLRRLIDYPRLSAYTRRLYARPGVAKTTCLDQVKLHYYDALPEVNPTVVPAGPAVDFHDGDGQRAGGSHAGAARCAPAVGSSAALSEHPGWSESLGKRSRRCRAAR